MGAVIQDVRFAVEDDSFASIVREGNHKLNDEIDTLFKKSIDSSSKMHSIADTSSNQNLKQTVETMDYADSDHTVISSVGDPIEVFSSLKNQYYSGTV